MQIKNLLDLQPNTVSRNIGDHSMMIVGESGIGKSELAIDIYGREDSLMLAFENSASGLAGANVVNIDSYATLTAYVGQLENPKVRERFNTIIIDTLFLFDYMCEKSVTDAYGVDIIKDALAYNAGFKIVDKRFLTIIKRLQKLDYTMCYVAHPIQKKVKDAQGAEQIRIEPKVSDRVKGLLLPEVDIILFATHDQQGQRIVYTQKTPYFDARCRIGQMPPIVAFDGNTIREEFAKGVDLIGETYQGLTVENAVREISEQPTYEELMAKIQELGKKAQELDKFEDANRIVVGELGCDDNSKPRTLADATPNMVCALETIVVKLEQLIG